MSSCCGVSASDVFMASCIPVLSTAGYINKIYTNFGKRFTIMMVSIFIGLKGILMTLLVSVQMPYYKSLKMDGIIYQTNSAVSHTPWAMKGLLGALSDSLPILGYYKRYYMVFAAICGTVAVVCLSLVPSSVAQSFPWVPAVLFFCVHFEIATLDLLCEGKYVEFMAKMPHTQGDVVTFVWLCVGIGAFLGSILVGPLSDHFGPWMIFVICIPLAFQVLAPLAAGFLPEEKVAAAHNNKFQIEKIRSQYKLFSLALGMAFCAVGMALVGLVGSHTIQVIYCALSSAFLCGLGFICLPRRLAKCNLYLFLQESLYLSIGGALDYFYTADEECLSGGPHFNYTYYTTYTGLASVCASGVGLWMFQTVMKKCKFRPVFWITTTIRIFASFFDFILIKRWNLVIGISDKIMYLLGDAIILSICTTMNFMPVVILTSKLCPKSMESTVYAILAGFSNFGANVSKLFGVFAIDMSGVVTKAPECDFSALPSLVFWSHGILPIMCIPLTFLLIPDARMSDNLLDSSFEVKGKDILGGGGEGKGGGGEGSQELLKLESSSSELTRSSSGSNGSEETLVDVVDVTEEKWLSSSSSFLKQLCLHDDYSHSSHPPLCREEEDLQEEDEEDVDEVADADKKESEEDVEYRRELSVFKGKTKEKTKYKSFSCIIPHRSKGSSSTMSSSSFLSHSSSQPPCEVFEIPQTSKRKSTSCLRSGNTIGCRSHHRYRSRRRSSHNDCLRSNSVDVNRRRSTQNKKKTNRTIGRFESTDLADSPPLGRSSFSPNVFPSLSSSVSPSISSYSTIPAAFQSRSPVRSFTLPSTPVWVQEHLQHSSTCVSSVCSSTSSASSLSSSSSFSSADPHHLWGVCIGKSTIEADRSSSPREEIWLRFEKETETEDWHGDKGLERKLRREEGDHAEDDDESSWSHISICDSHLDSDKGEEEEDKGERGGGGTTKRTKEKKKRWKFCVVDFKDEETK